MKYYKIIFVFFIFTSCDVSTISDIDAKSISKLKVNIYIQDGTHDNSLDELKVYLTDGKKKIINDKIKIVLNGKPLELFVKQELYYTKKSFYRDTNLLRSDSYYFEIVLPDNTIHPIAYLKPLKRDNVKFYIPKKTSRNENITIKWEDVISLTDLEAWKLVHDKKNINMHSGGRYSDTTIHETINSKNGKYVIPKSFYEDSLTVTDYLKVRINNMEKGLINPELLKNSSIAYNYTVEKIIDIEE